MKNLLIAVLIVMALAFSCFATMTSAISGKTMLGNNYMVYGTFTSAANTATAITTGLKDIRAAGVECSTAETIAGTTATQVIGYPVGGTLYIKAAHTNTPSGKWFVIGR